MFCKLDNVYLTYLTVQRQLSHLKVLSLTATKFMPLFFQKFFYWCVASVDVVAFFGYRGNLFAGRCLAMATHIVLAFRRHVTIYTCVFHP
jgi:hypothetical protein